MRKKLDAFRFELKEEMVKTLTGIYLVQNGCMPNWSAGEEIVVKPSTLMHPILFETYIETANGYITERSDLEEFRVNCSGDLFFVWGDGLNERPWDEECTDALMGTYEYLQRCWDNM